MKILVLIYTIWMMNGHKLYEREFLDIDEMTEQVHKELKAMENHSDFFEPLNIFY